MNIEAIVQQALEEGYLTPTMEAEVGKICDSSSELSLEEYMALDRLMGALLTGEVVAMPRKQFINVMEELVISEAIVQVGSANTNLQSGLDVGDLAAYALNRLPPLYATTEEGANYQRQRAREELRELIQSAVKEAVASFSERPSQNLDRIPINKRQREDILTQMNGLLKSYAVNYEQSPPGN
ncbi:MAG: hypothetical protein N5P05_001294 [Chroococcopsis gigantea SAG 12.99]|nr:late competence development ComFB family protein [Chlorogloea purpurea SAG 13.99]MDV2999688.1 hypothetical protein [Chroococcopsis gigantea SAG 12.99]